MASIALFTFVRPATANESIIIEKDIHSYNVNIDGSFSLTVELQKLIVTDAGISKAQQYYGYNASLDSVEVLEAYTEKPDGRKVSVRAEQIKTQQEPGSADFPMYQDLQYKVIIFPDVSASDRIYAKIRRLRHKPLFPGHFEDYVEPDSSLNKDLRVIYDMPTSLPLTADNVGFREISPVDRGERKIYEWRYAGVPNHRKELGSVAQSDYAARLSIGTFANYRAFASAYDNGAADKTVPSSKIHKFAAELTRRISDPKEKARVLYNWVRKNIRYVAVFVGPGGVVPHSAESVLDNRYGDCKDHVALFEALLTASGIESTPALINLGDAYKLPTAPSLGVLNHVITFIPSLDLFLDPTAALVEFGYLPMQVLDKPVILTKSGKMGRTPTQQFGATNINLRFQIVSDGSATFVDTETMEGSFAEVSRWQLRSMPSIERQQFVQRLIQQNGFEGSGSIDAENLDGDGSYRYEVRGSLHNFVSLPGPVGLSALSSFAGGIIAQTRYFLAEEDRDLAFTCVSQKVEEQATFEMPRKIRFVSVPVGISIKGRFFDYRSEYDRHDSIVTVKRSYQSRFPSAVCTPEQYREMKRDLSQMLGDLRRQIIVENQ